MLTDCDSRMAFCLALGMPEEAARICCANAFTEYEVRNAYRLLHASPDCFFSFLKREPPQRILALYIQFAEFVRPAFLRWGIPIPVYLDTFADIALWEQEYFAQNGAYGLGEYRWLCYHVRMELFRLGSLQFQTQAAPPAPVWKVVPIRPEDLVLHVHIPKGADLRTSAVQSSYQCALDFWKREEAVLLCDSWLLGPELQELLPPNSRIRSFAAGFTLVAADATSRQAEERIFGKVHDDPRLYTSSGSSLQHAAQAHLTAGGHLSAGYGWQRIHRDTT